MVYVAVPVASHRVLVSDPGHNLWRKPYEWCHGASCEPAAMAKKGRQSCGA
ncbi:hypothetical protein BCF46_2566 [Litoreibacter meonggei]|uniref:Uncharacterized protein n=1 Tax=Litoreibacter meonggei TaxID=1049199 RepID=A0A497VRL2_9RHOB|nr:hypothetical protein BCF46_2566 [Litoreibacter meonggei]